VVYNVGDEVVVVITYHPTSDDLARHIRRLNNRLDVLVSVGVVVLLLLLVGRVVIVTTGT
jgi:hypothetical protein